MVLLLSLMKVMLLNCLTLKRKKIAATGANGKVSIVSIVSIEKPNQYLDYLIDPMLKGEKRLFVLSFENNDHRTSFKLYFFQLLK